MCQFWSKKIQSMGSLGDKFISSDQKRKSMEPVGDKAYTYKVLWVKSELKMGSWEAYRTSFKYINMESVIVHNVHNIISDQGNRGKQQQQQQQNKQKQKTKKKKKELVGRFF